MKYYAVKSGRKTGIYASWTEAEKLVKGYPGAKYKSFGTLKDAECYMNGDIEGASTSCINVIDISEVRNEVQKTICFTGHRPKRLAGYTSRVPYTAFVGNLKEMLIPHIGQGYTRFVTGGAQGIDQLAFWAVEGLKEAGYAVKNIVFVPYEGQELRWSEKGMFSRQEYRLMLEKADGVVYLYRKGQSFKVVDALMERNHAMCDVSDKLIGVYEGIDFHNEKGGTAECLRYAEKMYLETTVLRFAA